MLTDSGWLQALKLPTRVMIGLLVACLVVLWLDHSNVLDLAGFGQLVRPLVVVAAVVAGALSLTGIAAFVMERLGWWRKQSLLSGRRQIRVREAEEKREATQATVLGRIDYLSPQELRYLADCLRENTQSFYAWAHCSYAATLISKGLVSTPGGTHHQDHYPYSINDFAWRALLARKDEIIEKDSANRKREEDASRRRRY